MPKKSEIISDVIGGTLKLSATRLTELTGEQVEGMHWYLPLSTLAKATKSRAIRKDLKIFSKSYTPKLVGYAAFMPDVLRIGCRYFDEKTFNKIMKAARKTTKKK
jgi:hypothetical protein